MSNRSELKGVGYGPPCPTNPDHGRLLEDQNGSSKAAWYCPHIEHGGRAPSHPNGPAAPTQAFFTREEAGW